MDASVYRWIENASNGEFKVVQGHVVAVDPTSWKELYRISFTDAWLRTIQTAALDVANITGDNQFYLTLHLAVRRSVMTVSSLGTALPAVQVRAIQRHVRSLGQKQKQWLCSNFRLSLDRIPSTRIRKIDSIMVRCKRPESDDSVRVDPIRCVFDMPVNSEDPLAAWALSDATPLVARSGTLVLFDGPLSSTTKKPSLQLTLSAAQVLYYRPSTTEQRPRRGSLSLAPLRGARVSVPT
jgi:hypothetical protein